MHDALLELGVNAAVVVGLALSLVLVRRLAGMGDDQVAAGAAGEAGAWNPPRR